MRFVTHSVYAAGIDPAIVKVEQRANGDRVIDRFIGVTRRMQCLDVITLNIVRVMVHLANEPHQSLFCFGQRGRFNIGKDTFDEFFAAQQFRRDRGVRLRSKNGQRFRCDV